jgi:hypothetical protein
VHPDGGGIKIFWASNWSGVRQSTVATGMTTSSRSEGDDGCQRTAEEDQRHRLEDSVRRLSG